MLTVLLPSRPDSLTPGPHYCRSDPPTAHHKFCQVNCLYLCCVFFNCYLFKYDLGPHLFQLVPDLLGLFLCHFVLKHLGRFFHQCFGFL